jgi:L,D-peptidoglycan transpeptidase YkuD (ErfK/YbiS/YcfS/YnhG family)
MAVEAPPRLRGPAAVLRSLSAAAVHGRLLLAGRVEACLLGRSGRRAVKREGDGATPVGRWRLERVLYRADRVARPRTALPVEAIRPSDGWCDEPGDRNYNRPVRLPYRASAERLQRDDGLYDIVVVLSHNRRPRKRGCGSAIFVHLAHPSATPTAGCIALEEAALRRWLWLAKAGSHVVVPG